MRRQYAPDSWEHRASKPPVIIAITRIRIRLSISTSQSQSKSKPEAGIACRAPVAFSLFTYTIINHINVSSSNREARVRVYVSKIQCHTHAQGLTHSRTDERERRFTPISVSLHKSKSRDHTGSFEMPQKASGGQAAQTIYRVGIAVQLRKYHKGRAADRRYNI
jgi:hypothetical protein